MAGEWGRRELQAEIPVRRTGMLPVHKRVSVFIHGMSEGILFFPALPQKIRGVASNWFVSSSISRELFLHQSWKTACSFI